MFKILTAILSLIFTIPATVSGIGAVTNHQISIVEENNQISKEEILEDSCETHEYVSDEGQKILHAPTELESEVLRLLNIERRKAGLESLGFNSEIYDCAYARTVEIIDCWGHTRPDGTNFRTIYEEYGIEWRNNWTSENLAGKFHSIKPVVEALMNSEGHRKNILCPDFKSVSLAVIETENGYYMAQLFWG